MSAISDLLVIPAGVSPERKYAQLLDNAQGLTKLTKASPPTPDETERLLSWITAVLVPTEVLLPPEFVLEDDDDPGPPAALKPYQDLCEAALQLLQQLSPAKLTNELRIFLISQTSPHDPWTTVTSQNLSTTLLSQHPPTTATLTALLTTLKPLFTAHRLITPSATAALRPSTAKAPLLITAPPHRSTHPATPTILHYAVSQLAPTDLETNWHLVVPPLLGLLDDTDTPTRTRACLILSTLLLHPQAAPLLKRSGLSNVLWDATFPCTLSLPPLTPTNLSLPLLRSSYAALMALADATAPPGRERSKLLGRLLRGGVLAGMQYSGETVAVVEVLLGVLGELIEKMGVWGVRYLGEAVGVVVAVLGGPFISASPSLVIAAVDATSKILKTTWVRAEAYAWEVVKAVVTCWGRFSQDGKEDEGVRGALRGALKVVRGVVGSEWEGVVKEIRETGVEGVGALVEGL